MSEARQWTFREIMVIALVREAGHKPVPMVGFAGQVLCQRCNHTFDISGRAAKAEDGLNPLNFPKCWGSAR